VRFLQGAVSPTLTTVVLIQGYLSAYKNLAWPPGVTEDPAGGVGAIVSVTGTTPGAGSEINETVPAGVIWQLKTFIYKLTTSATVANRTSHLIIDDGANVLLNSASVIAQVASNGLTYNTGDDAFSLTVADNMVWLQSVASLRLLPGYRLRTLTTNLQAGDQYTAPQYLVTEWLAL
jgi:hypothetical protein